MSPRLKEYFSSQIKAPFDNIVKGELSRLSPTLILATKLPFAAFMAIERGRPYCVLCEQEITGFIEVGEYHPVLDRLRVVGAGPRLGRCPNCRSRDRDRLVFLFLLAHTLILKPGCAMRVLHIAPERSLYRRLLANGTLGYIIGDLNMREGASKFDIRSLPFADSLFNVLICNHVLEHVLEDGVAMTEIKRVLKCSGWGLVQVPIAHSADRIIEDMSVTTLEARKEAFCRFDHVRIYTTQSYIERLGMAGLDVTELRLSVQLKSPHCELLGINPEESLFIVTPQHRSEG